MTQYLGSGVMEVVQEALGPTQGQVWSSLFLEHKILLGYSCIYTEIMARGLFFLV